MEFCHALFRFTNRDLQLVNHHTFDNSPLTSILPNSAAPQNFVRVTALNYDGSGNLWMCNNECDTIVRILKKDGKWKSLYISSIAGKPTFDHTVFDRRGWAWMVCRRTTNQTGASGFAIINANGTIDNTADDHYKYLSTIVNQNGERYTPDLCYCVTEDLNGAIWIGCTQGIFMSSAPDQVFETGFTMTQPIVPRNDGSGLGDYLLNGVPVKCIAVDGGNRKWIGTLSNGIYLISADGMETIEHFTEANSPLISDEINDIAINGSTGEVFIATAKGLCSNISSSLFWKPLPVTMMRTGVLRDHPFGNTNVPFRTAFPLLKDTSSWAYGNGAFGVWGRLSFSAPGRRVSGREAPNCLKVPSICPFVHKPS